MWIPVQPIFSTLIRLLILYVIPYDHFHDIHHKKFLEIPFLTSWIKKENCTVQILQLFNLKDVMLKKISGPVWDLIHISWDPDSLPAYLLRKCFMDLFGPGFIRNENDLRKQDSFPVNFYIPVL
jgi:hypothetical protein